MAKPTLLQSILGRPSQSYNFPRETQNYHSTRNELLRIAMQDDDGDDDDHDIVSNNDHKRISEQPIVVVGANGTTGQLGSRTSQHPSSPHSESSSDDDDDELFFTPNTSPRNSMLSHASLPFISPAMSSISLSTDDDHNSIFSAPASDSTRFTSPLNSESGRSSLKAPTSSPSVKAARRSSATYTDQDWAKDVRWLVTPESTSAPVSKPKRRPVSMPSFDLSSKPVPPHLQSSLLTQLPDMSSLSPPPGTTTPQPKPRKTMKVKAQTLTTKTRLTMTAVLEEDEHDPELVLPTSVQRKASGLARTPSSASSQVVKRTPSNSSSRHHPPHQKHSRSNSAPPSMIQHVLPEPYTPSASTYSASTALPSNGTPGFTSLVLPRAPPSTTSKTPGTTILEAASGKVDLTRSGLAQTTMASVEVCKGSAGRVQMQITMGKGFFKHTGSIRMKFGLSSSSRTTGGGGEDSTALGFMGYRNPPSYVPSGSVLVQVWAVGLDVVDKRIVHAKVGGVVPTSHHRYNHSVGTPSSSGRPSSEEQTSSPSPVFGNGASNDSGSSLRLGRLGMKSVKSIWNSRPRSADGNRDKGKEKETGIGIGAGKGGKKSKVEVGFIPGRSFVGRIMECGWDVKDGEKRGEWVVGLVDLRKCGALTEFIVVDRHRVHRVPHPYIPSRSTPKPSHNPTTALTLEELALLPICGVPAYRAVRTFSYALPGRERGGRVLVLGGASGSGVMSVKMLARRGWAVTAYVPRYHRDGGGEAVEEWEAEMEARLCEWGAEEVLFDDDDIDEAERGPAFGAITMIDRLRKDEEIFDAVLDTIGGKEIWEAGEKLLLLNAYSKMSRDRTRATLFTTLVGDVPERPIPTTSDHFRAGVRSRKGGERHGSGGGGSGGGGGGRGGKEKGKGGDGKVGYAWVCGAQDVDWEGEDVRNTLGGVLAECLKEGTATTVGGGGGVSLSGKGSGSGNGGRGVRPWVRERGSVVPLERAPEVFGGKMLEEGTCVVKIVG